MNRFDYVTTWQCIDESMREDLVAFWQRHGAIRDEQAARARAEQAVVVARTPDGELAGVCTVQQRHLSDLGRDVYYYRTFVAPPFRTGFIVRRLLKRAVDVLEDWSRRHPETSASAVYLELENPAFARHLRQAVWPRPGLEFVYIGRTPRGLERRILWFDHARV